MSDIYYCSNNKKKIDKMTSTEKAKNAINMNNNACKHNSSTATSSINPAGNGKTNWNTKAVQTNPSVNTAKTFHNTRCTRHHRPYSHHSHGRKTESVLSTDSDIRFTRRKLGDSQKCGCVVITGFLVALLVAGVFVYLGYTYFKPEPLPDRTFRGKFRVTNDKWSMELADQKSSRFHHKSRDYRERINMIVRRSDLRDAFEGSEVLALDGTDGTNDLLVHFNLVFDPYQGLVSTADLLAIFTEEINSEQRKYMQNITVDPDSLSIKEVTGLIDEPVMSSSPLAHEEELQPFITTTEAPPRRCEPLKLGYCQAVGYNVTTYPNLLGHTSIDEVQADVIAFREIVDSECFREAFDFVCRLLQPPCERRGSLEASPGIMCREYCQTFMKGCGARLLPRFRKYFDCELFPESTGLQTCQSKPSCAQDLQGNALSPRLCDGIADCPDLSDEKSCSFCSPKLLYCGRGRACVPRTARCDGKLDCPDGSDEKDCLSIAPLAGDLISTVPIVPYLPRFHSEGYAVFSEKGKVGKLCSEGLEGDPKIVVRQTVAESLCKSLGYDSVRSFDVRNDTEEIADYVRVLDPHAAEISFIRTSCLRKQVLYVVCGQLECGVQSVLSGKQNTLPKMASPGDWPWLVALYREDAHVCDGSLISADWVLTTESCFQGQPRATWLAIFGSIRLSSNAPWTQRRRIIGMVKSPVEGSTAALIRLETPVIFSDFVRPICLPDELTRKMKPVLQQVRPQKNSYPKAEKLERQRYTPIYISQVERSLPAENSDFFESPLLVAESRQKRSDSLAEGNKLIVAQQTKDPLALAQYGPYPLSADTSAHVEYYSHQPTHVHSQPLPHSYVAVKQAPEHSWTNCNTLGWSRQRDHLQRVQLRIGDMAHCENISIATVNSMCTEATYQKHDCTQEEYSGAPVQCLLPGTSQWALVGVSSWRIACGPTGVERPRMYDKMAPNSAWIRDTMYAI